MATLITFCFRGGVIVSGKKKVPVHPGLSHYYIFSNNVSAPLPGKIKKEEELIGVVDFHFHDIGTADKIKKLINTTCFKRK